MKTVAVLDDLDVAEGQALPPTHNIRFGWMDVWYEIDLNEQHAEDFWQGLKPYLDAARKVQPAAGAGTDRKAITASGDPAVPRECGVNLYHAVGISIRLYKKNLRKWAADRGEPLTSKTAPSGIVSYIYYKHHFEGYERWLTEQDRQRMAG